MRRKPRDPKADPDTMKCPTCGQVWTITIGEDGVRPPVCRWCPPTSSGATTATNQNDTAAIRFPISTGVPRRDREIGEAVANVFASWCGERENYAIVEYEEPHLCVEARTDGRHIYGPDDCILARQPGPSLTPDVRPVLLNDRAYRQRWSPYHVKHHVRHLLAESGIPFEPVKPIRPWGEYRVDSCDLAEWWEQVRAVRDLFDYAAIARRLIDAWLKGNDADESFGEHPARVREDSISGLDCVLVCRVPNRESALVLDGRLPRGSHNARLRAALEAELQRRRIRAIRVGIKRYDLRGDRELMIEAWEEKRRAALIESP